MQQIEGGAFLTFWPILALRAPKFVFRDWSNVKRKAVQTCVTLSAPPSLFSLSRIIDSSVEKGLSGCAFYGAPPAGLPQAYRRAQ